MNSAPPKAERQERRSLGRLLVWIRENGRDVFVSLDAILGLAAAVGTWFAARYSGSLRLQGQGVLLVEAGLGLAVLAVVLTALSILVAFLGEEYVLVLRKVGGGVAGAVRPYKVVSVISGTTAVVSLLGALAWDLWPTLQPLFLAAGTALTVWSVVGTIQLVHLTAIHGGYRARIPEIREAFRRGQEERRRNSA